MSYSKDNTVCVYSQKEGVLKLVTAFGDKYGINVFKCESEVDLMAVPSMFSVVDINTLGNDFFEYVEEINISNALEKYITYTEPVTELGKKYSKYFTICTNIESDFLARLAQ